MGSDSLIIDVLSIFFEGWCFKWVDTKVLSGGLLTRWVADLEVVNSFYVSKLWTTINFPKFKLDAIVLNLYGTYVRIIQ